MDIPRKHWLGGGRGFVLTAICALADIVHNTGIYAWPIHSLSCLSLHPINALMSSMQVSQHVVEEFWRNAYPCPLEEKARFNGQFIPSAPEVSGNVGNILPVFGPCSKGEVIDSAIHWVTFHRASNDVQFSLRKLDVLDIIVGYGDREVVGM